MKGSRCKPGGYLLYNILDRLAIQTLDNSLWCMYCML